MCKKQVNRIYVTSFVTFPRSGHHWLTRLLTSYFGDDFQYCEKYVQPEKMIDVCNTTNCEKDHDFDLKSSIHSDRKYLIQIRNFDDACISYYRLLFRESLSGMSHEEKRYVDVNSKEYLEFKNETKYYYDGFIQKWIMQHIPDSKLVIYDNLHKNTYNELKSIISFLTDDSIDEERLLRSSQTK